MAQTKVKGSMIEDFAITGLDIAGGAALTAPAVGDELMVYDLDATTNKKITLGDLMKVVTALTAETAPAVDDEILLYDTSGSAADKMTIANFLKVIDGLTEDTTPVTGDFIVTYDTSASAAKKVNLNKLALLANANTFTAPQKADTLALTHNTGWDGTAKQHLTVDVNGSSFTIANPSSATSGVYYTIFVTYTTSHSISWGANFKGVSGITPTATAGSYDHFTFRFDGTYMQCVGYALDTGA